MAYLKLVVLLAGASVVVGGCASGGVFGDAESPVTTASLPDKAKVDPACAGLSSQIALLRQEGVADRIEKAAAKKYKMTAADLTKADQLTKANTEFQAKCSVVKSASTAPAAVAVVGPSALSPSGTAPATSASPAAKASLVQAAPPAAPKVVKPAGQ